VPLMPLGLAGGSDRDATTGIMRTHAGRSAARGFVHRLHNETALPCSLCHQCPRRRGSLRERRRRVSATLPARTGTEGARCIALQLAGQRLLSAQVQELIIAKAFRLKHRTNASLFVENKVASVDPLEMCVVPDFWRNGSAFAREPAQLVLKPCLHRHAEVWQIHSRRDTGGARRGTRHGSLAALATRFRGCPKLAMPLHPCCLFLQETQWTTHPPRFASSRLLPAFQFWCVADATHTIPVTEHLLRLCKRAWCRIFTPALLLVKLAHTSFHVAKHRTGFTKHGVTHCAGELCRFIFRAVNQACRGRQGIRVGRWCGCTWIAAQ